MTGGRTDQKILLCTICSRRKNRSEKLLPALQRYQSLRIRKLFNLARRERRNFAILSGKFGLIHPHTPIPYYDQLLTENDIRAIATQIERFLKKNNIREIIFLLADPKKDPNVVPYIKSMEEAARGSGITLRLRYVPPYPATLKATGNQ